jgi:hypothetical protein
LGFEGQQKADHDIYYVGEDGGQKLIQVKLTAGTDGNFSWPHNEFWLAVSKQNQYYLVRVCGEDSYCPLSIEYKSPA